MVRFTSIALAIILVGQFSYAKVNIPSNMNALDRESTAKILGFGTSMKLLTDPYPLGGYSGFEMGLSVESIPITDISTLGSGSAEQDQFAYPTISVGKGIYNNFDVFLSFMPFNEGTGLSSYGALLRWGFYHAPKMPAVFSLVAHTNTTNINNQIINRTYGYDLTAGLHVQSFSVYIGAGQVHSNADFIGGASGITAEGDTRTTVLDTFHGTLGGIIHFDELFLSIQIDRYEQTVYSAKIGLRQ